jgi:UDP-GlcNAc:undecaprenyl-phosphate GlcNAc-1-phosphate transferase
MAVLLNAFLLCVVLNSYLIRFAPHLGLVDIPDHRKQHLKVTPVVGGIAIYVAFAFSLLLSLSINASLAVFLTGVLVLVVIGVVDDRQGLDARIKLLGQTIAVLVMILPDQATTVANLGNMFGQGDILLADAAIPLTVVFVVGSINAFNMIAGLDGVAGGIGIAGLLWLALVAALTGRIDLMDMALTLTCAMMGFLLFNLRHPWRSHAEVFLGDAGSMMIGAVLAFLAVRLSQGPEGTGAPPAMLLWTIAVPGIDMVSVVMRRIVRKRSPFAADRTHLHYVFLDCGFTPQTTALLLIALAALLGGCGMLGWVLGMPDYVMLWGLILPMAGHTYFVLRGWKSVRIPKRQSLIGLRERVS